MQKSGKRWTVYSLLRSVPKGKVISYAELARAAKTSPRAVGMFMKTNKDPGHIPCYKVVCSDGSIGGYSGNGGVKTKIRLLKKDGIRIINGKIEKGYFYKFHQR